MSANKNNMEAVWRNIRKIKGEIEKEKEKRIRIERWVDILACEVFECDDNDEPIYINADEALLGDSRIEKVEERLDHLISYLEDSRDSDEDSAVGAPAGGGKRRKRTRKKMRKKKTKKRRKKSRKKRTKRRR